MTRQWVFMGVLATAFEMGCAGGAARPDEINAAEAIGEGQDCTPESAKKDHDHFIVGWTEGSRTSLETAMGRGVAVVNYSCDGVKILNACKVDGGYNYAGVSRKTKLVEMADSGSMSAQLGGGANIPAELRAEIAQGRQLNLAYVLVGTWSTDTYEVTRDQLVGRCDGATHFLFEAQLGAFVLESGERGKAAAAATILGYGGASADQSSERRARTTDGDPNACDNAGSGDTEPISGCRALMRANLMAIK